MMSESSKAVETTGAEVAKFALDKLDSYFMAAQEVIEKYGGDAVDLGLMALRVDAISNILPLFLLSLVVFIIARYIPFNISEDKYLELKDKGYSDRTVKEDKLKEMYFVIKFVKHFLYGTVGLTMVLAFDIFSMVGIFYPEIYAVHKFLL